MKQFTAVKFASKTLLQSMDQHLENVWTDLSTGHRKSDWWGPIEAAALSRGPESET